MKLERMKLESWSWKVMIKLNVARINEVGNLLMELEWSIEVGDWNWKVMLGFLWCFITSVLSNLIRNFPTWDFSTKNFPTNRFIQLTVSTTLIPRNGIIPKLEPIERASKSKQLFQSFFCRSYLPRIKCILEIIYF